MYSLFNVVLLAVFSLAVAKTPFKDCGSTKATVTNVVISGCDDQKFCPLKKNTKVKFEVDFTSKEAANKLTSVVHGIIAGVPVPFPLDNPDACKDCDITCPIKVNDGLKYKTDISVKSAYPKVKLTVKWEVKDEDSNDIFCVEVPAEIVD